MTPERFRDGMTFDEYVRYVGTAENLRREAGWWLGPKRPSEGTSRRKARLCGAPL